MCLRKPLASVGLTRTGLAVEQQSALHRPAGLPKLRSMFQESHGIPLDQIHRPDRKNTLIAADWREAMECNGRSAALHHHLARIGGAAKGDNAPTVNVGL